MSHNKELDVNIVAEDKQWYKYIYIFPIGEGIWKMEEAHLKMVLKCKVSLFHSVYTFVQFTIPRFSHMCINCCMYFTYNFMHVISQKASEIPK